MRFSKCLSSRNLASSLIRCIHTRSQEALQLSKSHKDAGLQLLYTTKGGQYIPVAETQNRTVYIAFPQSADFKYAVRCFFFFKNTLDDLESVDKPASSRLKIRSGSFIKSFSISTFNTD